MSLTRDIFDRFSISIAHVKVKLSDIFSNDSRVNCSRVTNLENSSTVQWTPYFKMFARAQPEERGKQKEENEEKDNLFHWSRNSSGRARCKWREWFSGASTTNPLLPEAVQAGSELPINTITTSGPTYSALCRTYDAAILELGTRYRYYVSTTSFGSGRIFWQQATNLNTYHGQM